MKNKLITHLVCWYPNLKESNKILSILDKHSCFIEVQFPFSDPIADWEVISNANETSLKNWISVNNCFEFLESNKEIAPKLIIMTYYNLLYNFWVEEFIKKASSMWVYGLIIPDIPFDEKEGIVLYNLCKKYFINLIYVVSPNCAEQRIKKILSIWKGFIYAISQNMTTWNYVTFWKDFDKYIKTLKNWTNLKIWVWFWIKTKEDIKSVLKVSDFAIIWSEIIRQYEKKWIVWVEKYMEEINKSLD